MTLSEIASSYETSKIAGYRAQYDYFPRVKLDLKRAECLLKMDRKAEAAIWVRSAKDHINRALHWDSQMISSMLAQLSIDFPDLKHLLINK